MAVLACNTAAGLLDAAWARSKWGRKASPTLLRARSTLSSRDGRLRGQRVMVVVRHHHGDCAVAHSIVAFTCAGGSVLLYSLSGPALGPAGAFVTGWRFHRSRRDCFRVPSRRWLLPRRGATACSRLRLHRDGGPDRSGSAAPRGSRLPDHRHHQEPQHALGGAGGHLDRADPGTTLGIFAKKWTCHRLRPAQVNLGNLQLHRLRYRDCNSRVRRLRECRCTRRRV